MGSKPDNVGVPGISFFAPQHEISPGAAVEVTSSTPTLFTPLKIRDVTLKNRIIVAPMCQYSTAATGPQIGALTPYHVATLGHYALKGAALTMIEASGVQPNGRISPNCPGIWSDDQIPGVRQVAEFIKAQGGLSAIQLAHAGRKASTLPPWINARQKKASVRAAADVGGWPEDVVGPTGGHSWDEKPEAESGFYPPRELSIEHIKQLVADWANAARRSAEAGIDVIEIHGAHGYLIHQFLSPITNRRTDAYGGSFEKRTRLLFEIIAAIRNVIPSGMPLFLRLSSTEWMEDTDLGKKYGSWDVESTIEVARKLKDEGVDFLDVSSGGNHPGQRINMFSSKDYQTRIASRIRNTLRSEGNELLIGAVGLITEAEQARDILQSNHQLTGEAPAPESIDEPSIEEEAKAAVTMTDDKGKREPMADAILVARQFMREPEWVLKIAAKLSVDVAWPSQFLRVRFAKL